MAGVAKYLATPLFYLNFLKIFDIIIIEKINEGKIMGKEKDENTIQILLQRIIDLTRENEQLKQENENLKEQLASAYRDNRVYYEQSYGRC